MVATLPNGMRTAFALLLAMLVITSCSKNSDDAGDSAGGATSTAALEELREEILILREEAEGEDARKYAAKEFDKANDHLEEAEDLLTDDEVKLGKVRAKLNRAKSGFKTAKNSAKKNKTKFERVNKTKKKYADNLAKAEEAKLPFKELDPEGWKEAQEKLKEADELMADGEMEKARRRAESALSTLQGAIDRATAQIKDRTDAEGAEAKMKKAKEAATEAKAMELATSDMTYAESQERLAKEKFDDAEYQLAASYFQTAESFYQTALAMAQGKEMAQNAPPKEIDGNVVIDPERETYEEAPSVDKIKPPTNDGDSAGYGGDLEVAAALSKMLHGSPDFRDGMLHLEYVVAGGAELAKDVDIIQGKKDRHIRFQGLAGVGVEDYCLAGNTLGYVLFKPVFRNKVKIEVEFQAQFNAPNDPTFQLVINSNGGQNYYGAHYGSSIVVSTNSGNNKVTPSARKEYRQHVNKWLRKTETIMMRMEYVKPDPDVKGQVRVFFNDEEICRRESDLYQGGRVGFLWSNAKWFVKEVRISGELDEKWAASIVSKGSEGEEEEDDDFDF